MGKLDCNLCLELQDITLDFDVEHVRASIMDIRGTDTGFVMTVKLFYFYPESETATGLQKPPGIEATIEVGEITKRQMLYLLENREFSWADWDIWNIKEVTYWNMVPNVDNEEKNRELDKLLSKRLPESKATITISDWA